MQANFVKAANVKKVPLTFHKFTWTDDGKHDISMSLESEGKIHGVLKIVQKDEKEN